MSWGYTAKTEKGQLNRAHRFSANTAVLSINLVLLINSNTISNNGSEFFDANISNIEYQHSELMYQDGLNDSIQLNKDQIQFLVSYSFKL